MLFSRMKTPKPYPLMIYQTELSTNVTFTFCKFVVKHFITPTL